MNDLQTLNASPITMKVNGERPHYYHVICYDLIVETMIKNGEKVIDAEMARFCLVCAQEKVMQAQV